MTAPSANDLLFSGGSPAISFKDAPIGTRYSFTITAVRNPQQQTDYATGAPQTWQDGRPKMTVPVDVRLDPGFTPRDAEDDGSRSWWIPVGSQLQKAAVDAVRKAGQRGLEAGARVSVAFTGTEPSKIRGGSDKKLYAVTYAPGSAGSDALMSQPAPVSPPPIVPSAADPGAVAAAMAALTPDQRRALGLPDF